MSNELIEYDNNQQKIRDIMNFEYYPLSLDEDLIRMDNQIKLPIDSILSLGVGFESVSEGLKEIVGKEKFRTGYYKVTVPEGRTLGDLAKRKDGKGYLGTVLNEKNQVGGGQAILNPQVLNPTLLVMAVALKSIEKRLVKIQEIQEEVLAFLVQKEKSLFQLNLKFLNDIFKNFKFNWNNDQYKSGNHIKVLDIKQSSESKIDFYREGIKSKINRNILFSYNKKVENNIKLIELELKEYQLSMYLFAFSSFLEVLLLENYDDRYLDSISNKIENYSFEYRVLYTKIYNYIESNSLNSIENKFLDISASLSNYVGTSVEKIPIIKNKNLGKSINEFGNDLEKISAKNTDKITNSIVDKRNSYVYPFIENIKELNKFYNMPLDIKLDSKNVYIEFE